MQGLLPIHGLKSKSFRVEPSLIRSLRPLVLVLHVWIRCV